MKKSFTHINKEGSFNMVDISDKSEDIRIASATGFIRLQKETLQMINENTLKKGDVLTVAEIAGIMAAKNVPQLIPLCHNILIVKVNVKAYIEEDGIRVNSWVKCVGKTGVEMEALTAVSITLLTIYDMCKAVDKTMKIENIILTEKIKLKKKEV